MNTSIVILFFIFLVVYFTIILGLMYLIYEYIKFINNLEKEGCKCSNDVKRDMIKNVSYLILISWVFLIIGILFTPPKELYVILNSKIATIINILVIGGYGYLLFSYSKKLIDESCKCSESWVREAMQYHSYIYIWMSIVSVFIFLIKLLIGNDKKEIHKILSVLKKK